MNDYNGIERIIRETNKLRFQVLPENYTADDLSRAPVFATRAEAEAYIRRPMPKWVIAESDRAAERSKYTAAYAQILSSPDMREMRRVIQGFYGEACHLSKLAGAHQRAAIRGGGQISCMGRDVGAVRQVYADEVADDASVEWSKYDTACGNYERELQRILTEAEIPVELFRTPAIRSTIRSEARPGYERFPELRRAELVASKCYDEFGYE
jgi:hypothetical protein